MRKLTERSCACARHLHNASVSRCLEQWKEHASQPRLQREQQYSVCQVQQELVGKECVWARERPLSGHLVFGLYRKLRVIAVIISSIAVHLVNQIYIYLYICVSVETCVHSCVFEVLKRHRSNGEYFDTKLNLLLLCCFWVPQFWGYGRLRERFWGL